MATQSEKPRHFEGMKFVSGGYVADHDETATGWLPLGKLVGYTGQTNGNNFMAFKPERYDPDSCNKARDLLAEYKRPNGEIVLNLQRSSHLEQAIADAIHASRGVPKP